MVEATKDHYVGMVGEALRVPDERLTPLLQGDVVATLDYWWIHTPGQGMLVVHVGQEPTDMPAVRRLEVLLPSPEDEFSTYALGLITLADIPGVPPANKRWPWVTHELLVHTVDTTKGAVSFDSPLPWPLMQPHNLSVQFQVNDDDQAREVVSEVARGVANGLLPGEVQAYVPERKKMMTLAPLWTLWQDTVNATAEHVRTGGTHDEPRGGAQGDES